MNIDKDHILKLADLANLTLTEEEIDSYKNDINRVLELISEINEVDTTGVEPLYNVLEEFAEVRDDKQKITTSRDDAIKNAPDTDGVHFQVPLTIKHNKEESKKDGK